ncbi:hypothetical protein ACP70R_006721 [Stipagrostis hirtigluma subsp. patula]
MAVALTHISEMIRGMNCNLEQADDRLTCLESCLAMIEGCPHNYDSDNNIGKRIQEAMEAQMQRERVIQCAAARLASEADPLPRSLGVPAPTSFAVGSGDPPQVPSTV